MLHLILPVGIALLGGLAYHKASKNADAKMGLEAPDALTPNHALIYQSALKSLQDPEKLRKLAGAFRAQGYEPQAVMLEKRANIRSLPAETKQARRAVYRKAMASTNKAAIFRVASAYENEGATGAADSLRAYAAGLP